MTPSKVSIYISISVRTASTTTGTLRTLTMTKPPVFRLL
nr:MAG TPA: hypothetical protein [Caudoviricetes sp.]